MTEPGRTDAAAGPAADDEAPIRALLARLEQAWTAGDATAFADQFTDDADYTSYDGTLLAGRAAILDAHRALFGRFLKNSRLVIISAQIRFATPTVAVVTANGAVLLSWQRTRTTTPRRRISAQTFVAVKQDGRWLFTAFQNTRFRPFQSTPLGRLLAMLSARGPGRPGT